MPMGNIPIGTTKFLLTKIVAEEADRQRDRQTEKQTDRQTDRQTERPADRRCRLYTLGIVAGAAVVVVGGAGVVALAAAGVKVQGLVLLNATSSMAMSPVYDLPRIPSIRICVRKQT